MNKQQVQITAWCISGFVAALAFVAWGQDHNWQSDSLSGYALFPLFGLLAFSIMWSHYIAVVLRKHFKIETKTLSKYFERTSLVVLFFILLHPFVLSFQLWRDGFGIPPNSYLQNYVEPAMRWVVALGMLSLLIFLSYELRRKYNKKPWWKYFRWASDVAMLFIFYHGLTLGSQLQTGWFRIVWIFYGITLILALLYIHIPRNKPHKS